MLSPQIFSLNSGDNFGKRVNSRQVWSEITGIMAMVRIPRLTLEPMTLCGVRQMSKGQYVNIAIQESTFPRLNVVNEMED